MSASPKWGVYATIRYYALFQVEFGARYMLFCSWLNEVSIMKKIPSVLLCIMWCHSVEYILQEFCLLRISSIAQWQSTSEIKTFLFIFAFENIGSCFVWRAPISASGVDSPTNHTGGKIGPFNLLIYTTILQLCFAVVQWRNKVVLGCMQWNMSQVKGSLNLLYIWSYQPSHTTDDTAILLKWITLFWIFLLWPHSNAPFHITYPQCIVGKLAKGISIREFIPWGRTWN